MRRFWRARSARGDATPSNQDCAVHLVCEADSNDALSRGLKGLASGISRRLNKLWKRTGSVWADRYFVRAAKTPTETRNLLGYVLNNRWKHWLEGHDPRRPIGAKTTPWGNPDVADPYSSGRWFKGWDVAPEATTIPSPVARAKSWLLRVGWLRAGGPIARRPRFAMALQA